MNLHTENAQNEIIECLDKQLQNLEFQIRNYKKVIGFSKPHADFYLDMQRQIIADENTMKAWRHFMMMVKLSIDSEKGLTE